jgi:uncharacterized protein (TIGR03083 family)
VGVIPIDWATAKAAVDTATADVTELLRSAPDPNAAVPRLDWNVGEVGAHIVTAIRGYISFARGESSSLGVQTMAEANEQRLRDYTTRDPAHVADDIERDAQAFLSMITTDDSKMTLNDERIDRSAAAAVLLGELRIHGLDISRAVHRRWKITPGEALMIGYAALAVAHKFVNDKTLRATYEVRYRGGETVSLTFYDGALTVVRGRATRADCRISVAPVTGLLLAYGRISRFRAALAGRTIVWGRKPWLAFRFNNAITNA